MSNAFSIDEDEYQRQVETMMFSNRSHDEKSSLRHRINRIDFDAGLLMASALKIDSFRLTALLQREKIRTVVVLNLSWLVCQQKILVKSSHIRVTPRICDKPAIYLLFCLAHHLENKVEVLRNL